MEFFKKYKVIILIFLGGAAGYSYYYFIGCNSGCLITGSPYISTIYGSLLGFILGFPTTKKERIENDGNN